jgi:hypothetical protein
MLNRLSLHRKAQAVTSLNLYSLKRIEVMLRNKATNEEIKQYYKISDDQIKELRKIYKYG